MAEAAAPAVAPAPAATPATPSAPPPSGRSTFSDGDAFSSLDALVSGSDESPDQGSTNEPEVKSAPEKKGSDPLDPQSSKAAEKKSEVKPDVKTDKTPAEFNPDKAAPKQLREAYSKLKAKQAEMEKEISEFKSKPKPVADDPEKKQYQEKATTLEKRVQELEEELKFSNFEKHPDYAEQYEKPFIAAYNAGRERASRLKVTAEDGSTRPGTASDFDAIMKIQDDDSAAEKAVEMFGNKAALILYHRERSQEINSARVKAVEDYRTKGSERDKARKADMEKFQGAVTEEVKTLWNESVTGAMEKYKQWSQPVEGDIKGNELLEKGYKLANEAFSSFDVMNPNLDKQQRADLVKKHAAVRNRAAWFDRLAYQNSSLSKENKALKSKLADFEKSIPGKAEGNPNGSPAEETWESRLSKKVR